MKSFFEFLDKFISEFSWRKLILLLLFVILMVGIFFIYETYTHSYKLSKIERTTALLKEFSSLKTLISQDSTLLPIYQNAKTELLEISNSSLSIPSWLYLALKGLFGALPWLLMIIAIFPAVLRGEQPSNAIAGAMVFVFVFGVIGMLLTDQWGVTFNFIYYPIGHFIMMAALLIIYDYRNKLKLKKMQEISNGAP